MSDDITGQGANSVDGAGAAGTGEQAGSREDQEKKYTCLLYTSDAADE